ncbi:MAG: hypothetical protein B6D36_13305 [Planctomycetes bacterium UTPLA1]|nr:MAG: hypothetical protein B6D36_13305 [Planctomycetes bacterium UTPLA1]
MHDVSGEAIVEGHEGHYQSRTTAKRVLMMKIMNLSAEPDYKLHSWLPNDLDAETVLFLSDACPGRSPLPNADIEFHRGECARLTALLEQAQAESRLPDEAAARPALSDLLIRLRQRSS